MSERYSRLFTLPENLYATGSPILIAAGALLKDNQTGKVLVQLKLQNIGTKRIKAATVSIQPQDVVGSLLGNEVVYQYLDLSANRNGEFGAKTPITLSNLSTRSYSAKVIEVIFTDNTVWQASDEPWETLISPVPLERFLGDHELVKQYRIKFGADCKYKPAEQKDLWHCTCGELNQQLDTLCHRCRKALSSQLSVDVTALKQDMDNRTAAEQKKAAEDRAAAEAQAKKVKRIAIIATVIICVMVAAISIINEIITKTKLNEDHYNRALSLMAHEVWADAVTEFEQIGNYKDSKDKLLQCKYAYVQSHLNVNNTTTYDYLIALKDANYLDAATIYNTLFIPHIDMVATLSIFDKTNNIDTAQRSDTIYFHYTLTGGPSFTQKSLTIEVNSSNGKIKEHKDVLFFSQTGIVEIQANQNVEWIEVVVYLDDHAESKRVDIT